jgi:hypothetical protein
MALQASALETVPTLVGGGLAGLVCLWLLRARAKRACPVASGALAERHVSRAALASLSSQASVDLSYARAPSASWWRRHRGVFVLSELPLGELQRVFVLRC